MHSSLTTSYHDVKRSTFASAMVPDGVSGHKAKVEVALLGQEVMYVTDKGYYRAGMPKAKSKDDALLLLECHPDSRASAITAF